MKLVVLGGTGRTGKEVVRLALRMGYGVTVLSRGSTSIGIDNPNLSVVNGDAREKDVLIKLLSGHDAVINTLSSIKGGDKLFARSTKSLIAAAHKTDLKRIILMSSFLISPSYMPNMILKVASLMMKSMLQDKSSGERILMQSDLDWTIVYATALDRAPAGVVRIVKLGETVGMKNGIARADVAKFMLETLKNETTFKKALVITSK